MPKTTIKACPTGLPFAVKMSEVTPITEAISVIKFLRSKIKNEATISATDTLHNTISPVEKYFVFTFFSLFISITSSNKKRPPYVSSKTLRYARERFYVPSPGGDIFIFFLYYTYKPDFRQPF